MLMKRTRNENTGAAIRDRIAAKERELAEVREAKAAKDAIFKREPSRALLAEITELDADAKVLEQELVLAHDELSVAEKAERDATQRAWVESVRAEVARVVNRGRREILPTFPAIGEWLSDLAACGAAVRAANQIAQELGIAEIEDANRQLRGEGGREYENFEAGVRLPDPSRGRGQLWPSDTAEGRSAVDEKIRRLRAA